MKTDKEVKPETFLEYIVYYGAAILTMLLIFFILGFVTLELVNSVFKQEYERNVTNIAAFGGAIFMLKFIFSPLTRKNI